MKHDWELIIDEDGFMVEYDRFLHQYRISYFEDCHYIDDIIFDEVKNAESN